MRRHMTRHERHESMISLHHDEPGHMAGVHRARVLAGVLRAIMLMPGVMNIPIPRPCPNHEGHRFPVYVEVGLGLGSGLGLG